MAGSVTLMAITESTMVTSIRGRVKVSKTMPVSISWLSRRSGRES